MVNALGEFPLKVINNTVPLFFNLFISRCNVAIRASTEMNIIENMSTHFKLN